MFSPSTPVITCRCVLERGEPVRFVSHAGGDWQFYCHDSQHDFDDEAHLRAQICVAHLGHLLERDASLHELADLDVDMGAERASLNTPWQRFANADDD